MVKVPENRGVAMGDDPGELPGSACHIFFANRPRARIVFGGVQEQDLPFS